MSTEALPAEEWEVAHGTDLGAALTAFAEVGYCVIPGVLSPEEVQRVRQQLVDVAKQDRDAGLVRDRGEGPNNQRVWALTHKGDAFVFLLEHPLLWAFMSEVLNSEFLLSSITANIAGPGGPCMALHADQLYVPPPWPPFPLVANMMWMLDDFTEDNGATRVVPGSHRWFEGGRIDPALAERTVPAVGAAGSVLCFDGRLLHQTGANRTADQFRHGVLTYCSQPWIRQQENSSLSVPESIRLQLSDRVRQLIGLKLWAGLGCVDGPEQRGLERVSR